MKGLLEGGLESSTSAATAAAHDYQTLPLKANVWGLAAHCRRDLSVANTPTMCGRWIADDRCRASDNSTYWRAIYSDELGEIQLSGYAALLPCATAVDLTISKIPTLAADLGEPD